MGLFDDIIVGADLPDGKSLQTFQTKQFACCMDKYEITKTGRLLRQTEDGKEDINYHGWVNFYTHDTDNKWCEYNAKFTDGNLIEIVAVEVPQASLKEQGEE